LGINPKWCNHTWVFARSSGMMAGKAINNICFAHQYTRSSWCCYWFSRMPMPDRAAKYRETISFRPVTLVCGATRPMTRSTRVSLAASTRTAHLWRKQGSCQAGLSIRTGSAPLGDSGNWRCLTPLHAWPWTGCWGCRSVMGVSGG